MSRIGKSIDTERRHGKEEQRGLITGTGFSLWVDENLGVMDVQILWIY